MVWRWVALTGALGAHGPGPWRGEERPVLRPLDGPLGWRLGMANAEPNRWGSFLFATGEYYEEIR
jgi:hypothetical protein